MIQSESDRIAIQLGNCRGHMQELGQNGLGCSMQVGWLGFEHPIQTGTTHISQPLGSQVNELGVTTKQKGNEIVSARSDVLIVNSVLV